MNILVLGYIVRGPLGGLAWHHLQYVLGLIKLGHNVLFLEDSNNYESCYNPESFIMSNNPAYGLKFTQELFNDFDLKNWSYYDAHTDTWYGIQKKEVLEFCSRTDVVLNLSGVNPLREWWVNIPVKVFVDTDPVFTQIKHLTNSTALEIAHHHTHFITFGENYNKESCSIPDDGFDWKPTRQPVFIDVWGFSENKSTENWTTLMQWDSYKKGEYNGTPYGMKSESFKEYFSLPKFVEPQKLELSLGSKNAPRKDLEKEGWYISDPTIPSKDHRSFQKFIANSKAEWSVAKHGYVISNSGWFSERTLNYMASGKPAVVQETGFSEVFPTGEGVLPFSNLEESIEQINKVNSDYNFHCKKAREIVEEYFESGKVLTFLINKL